MPQTETLSRQLDQFALGIAIGKTQEQAALDAGYAPTTARHGQHRMLAVVGVKERIQHYKQQLHDAGEKFNVTPEWIVQNAAELATQRKELASAVSATRLLADILGQLGGGKSELPPGLDNLLDALGEGLKRGSPRKLIAQEVSAREAPALEQPADPPYGEPGTREGGTP